MPSKNKLMKSFYLLKGFSLFIKNTSIDNEKDLFKNISGINMWKSSYKVGSYVILYNDKLYFLS